MVNIVGLLGVSVAIGLYFLRHLFPELPRGVAALGVCVAIAIALTALQLGTHSAASVSAPANQVAAAAAPPTPATPAPTTTADPCTGVSLFGARGNVNIGTFRSANNVILLPNGTPFHDACSENGSVSIGNVQNTDNYLLYQKPR